MTRFTVVWLQGAENDLAEIWQAAADRREITAAGDRVDQKLAIDPHVDSQYLSELLWCIDDFPLRVYFGLRLDDRVVEVSNVALMTEK